MPSKRKALQYISLLLFIILTGLLVRMIALNLDFLSPFQKAVENFDVSDYAYTTFDQDSYFEDDIVLVNLGNINRAEIAQVVDSISAHLPSVIGLDALFYGPKNPVQDFQLFNAIKNAGNVVLSCKLDSLNNEGNHAAIREPYALFGSVSTSAYANLVTGLDDGFRTSRTITPKETVNDSVVWSFPSMLAKMHSSSAFQALNDRDEQLETINWVGNVNCFFRLHWSEVLKGGETLDVLKGKVVIIGYLGPRMGEVLDFEDAFFTPLNENPVGRAFPDMYGPVVHANALSMMLKSTYIYQFSGFWSAFIGLCFLLFNAFVFQRIMWWNNNAFELLSRIIQLVQLLIIWAITIYLLAYWRVKIDMSYALFAVVLSADCVDIYESTFANKVDKLWNRLNRRKLT